MDWFQEYKKLVFSNTTSVEQINRAILLKYEHIPKILYKYRTVNEYSINNLLDNTIWLSDPKNFNDPYDCSFHYNIDLESDITDSVLSIAQENGSLGQLTEEQIQSISKSNDPMVRLLELRYPDKPDFCRAYREAIHSVMKDREKSLVRKTSEGFKQAFKICCFSENPKSILMWSHYADYHTGFCIGYDFCELGNEDLRTRAIYPVIYSDKMFDASNVFGENETTSNILYINQVALIKSTGWAYEKEWRLVFGNMVLQKEMSCRMPKPKHVILGAKISPANEEKIREICGVKDIEVFKMTMSHDQFFLNIEK
ncbi:DUF2971 domain-containing protein [Aeromonas enteropelogenes]|uniref:DUF2971 domain-containing protein n=1 Tax=Aeromonas enteropelogenes TaxID=29489 RepID=UPI0038D0C10F